VSTVEQLRTLRQSFEFYAPRCLKIVTKDGTVVPFRLNKAQQFINSEIEDQIRRKGYARKILLKGRQQGASTLITGRYYYKSTGAFGTNVGILTHEMAATDNLFSMVRRYHEHCPRVVRPRTAADSAKELYFDKLDSRYRIATAGSKGTGRSMMMRLFHGSEVAFWPNALSHMAGIGQAVPLLPGTEIILESTANGIGNLFHSKWLSASREDDDADGMPDVYEPIFVPWFWQDEYRMEVPPGFVLDAEEAEYADIFDLDMAQMAWRRMKIRGDFDDDVALFNQEYPATPEMAFMAGSSKSLISPLVVAAAMKPRRVATGGPLIVGVDPAEYGSDRTGVVVRHGRQVTEIHREKMGPMELVGWLGLMIDRLEPDAVCIDVGGSHGVADRLIELNYRNIYKINFGSSPIQSDLYLNKRVEMWDTMANWLKDMPVSVPADKVLRSDLSAPEFTYDSSRRKVLESKEKMKARGIPSPDLGDALALTFAVQVRPKKQRDEPWREAMRRKMRRRDPMAA